MKREIAGPLIVSVVFLALLAGFASKSLSQSVLQPRFHPVRFLQSDDVTQAPQNAKNSADAEAMYAEGLSLLRKYYYGSIGENKTRQLTYDAIRGMLLTLHDPFTSFLDPDEWLQFQETTTRGDFEGIGTMLRADPPRVIVDEVIEGGPAEHVGMKAGDVITRVNNTSVVGMDINDVVKLIKGPAGTKVHITVARGNKTIEFTITRARVEPPVVKYWMEDQKYKIGHIYLSEFNEKSLEQLNKAFAALQAQGMRALVFDLRSDPGGLLEKAVEIASIFIPKNSVPALHNNVVIIHEGDGEEQGRKLENMDTLYKHRVPLVVLVNDSSASASEIVTGAIKDYGAGTIIGQRTYGKGCVQTLFQLDDGSCLRLTTALYYPPKHYDINYQQDENHNRIPGTGGILPDIEVLPEPNWQGLNDKAHDKQLQAALTFLRDRLNGISIAQATAAVKEAFSPKTTAEAAKSAATSSTTGGK